MSRAKLCYAISFAKTAKFERAIWLLHFAGRALQD